MSDSRRPVGFDHIVLVCRDIATTVAWYQQRFGLDGVRLEQWRAGSVPFPSLRVDGSTIIDFVAGQSDGAGHVDHICFVVTAELLAELRSAVTIVDEGDRYGARGIGRSIYFRDPDGLLVEARTYG